MGDRSLGHDQIRAPSPAEMRAMGHPVRLRIMRLCRATALTNQELADRLELAPATVLRHVRELVTNGFLCAEEVRTGPRGALERPYRSTRLALHLAWDAAEAPELLLRVEIAMLHAHRAELVEAGPGAARDRLRYTLRLTRDTQDELRRRLHALLAEFDARDEPDGEPLSLLWLLNRRAPEPPEGPG